MTMRIRSKFLSCFLFLPVAILGGCATYTPPEPTREPAPVQTESERTESSEEKTTQSGEIQERADNIDKVSARQNGDFVILTLEEKILFELGKAKIKRTAWPTLDEIAKLLVEYPNRMVMVQGHTDDLPTRSERFPSNWDLSAQRAVNVVKYISHLPELDDSRLVAAGFGEYHPRVPNDSEENRQLNRRVEIILYPTNLPEVTIPVPRP